MSKRTLKLAKVFIRPSPKEDGVYKFKLAFRNKYSSVSKYYEETDEGKEEKPKFENLEVFYADSDAYNITRIRVCYEYDHILTEIKHQLQEDQKEAENLGDTLRINLCQESIDSLQLLEDEMKQEIEFIHQQRATKVNNMNEIELSAGIVDENLGGANQELLPKIKPGVYNHLAMTQKREEIESRVRSSSGNYYYYQLADESNCFMHPL